MLMYTNVAIDCIAGEAAELWVNKMFIQQSSKYSTYVKTENYVANLHGHVIKPNKKAFTNFYLFTLCSICLVTENMRKMKVREQEEKREVVNSNTTKWWGCCP